MVRVTIQKASSLVMQNTIIELWKINRDEWHGECDVVCTESMKLLELRWRHDWLLSYSIFVSWCMLFELTWI
jgi:hypothetical protein